MMSIEKVYDELYGMIEDLKKQIAAGSGTDVTITPALEDGTKIADYAIDGTEGALYAPEILITPSLQSGAKIADFEICGVESALYAPLPADISNTEKEIGTFDAEPLFCKKIHIAALPDTAYQETQYPHGLTNVTIVGYVGYARFAAGNLTMLPHMAFTNSGLDVVSSINSLVTATSINIKTGQDRSTMSADFVLFYTKTPPEEAKKTTKKK